MKELFQSMRTLLEGASPLTYHAAAVFLKHEEPRWTRLAENTDLLKERFAAFLNSPAAWDFVIEYLNESREDWKETRCELCQGSPGAMGSCRKCDGKGWYWLNQKSQEQDIGYGNPVKYGRVNEAADVRIEPSGAKFKLVDNKGRMLQGQFATRADAEKQLKKWKDIDAEYEKSSKAAMLGGTRVVHPTKKGVLGYTYTAKKGASTIAVKWDNGSITEHPPSALKRYNPKDAKPGYHDAHITEEGEGGAPANAAGNGGVAGIGQPPGSKFGEPGFALGGATTKTKKKNKRPDEDDLDEGIGDWFHGISLSNSEIQHVLANAKAALQVYPPNLIPQLRKLYAAAVIGSRPNPTAVVRLRQFLRDNGMVYEAVSDKDVEIAAKEVHDRWVKNQKADGETEHKSPDGKEDYMVPYDKLSDKSKEMDREAVRATLDALKLKEDAETFAGSPVFEVGMDKWMASRFGKKRYHRYSRYVGNDEFGETIRQHGRTTKDDIVLKDQTTGVMTYLRRKAPRA